ncbi:Stress response protein SCP2 [Paenibacillus sp. 1_12]|uniref:TerD family protein n=1 Tax=Paenibacillus sp. 1_12 TaxID=1566278 RepID=UPI0008F40C34|nr:TerD family protein [Paenibacillus sp. 1_12]SFL65137.1 Stress response protein SCP2 [Paenibacillus sp. 1_12]
MANSITALLAGANTTLVKEPSLEVTVSWISAPAELDLSCFMIGENGKVPSDDYFIFYNQPADPQQLVKYKRVEANAVVFLIDLERLLASGIDKCVFAATLDGGGTFKAINGCKVICRTSEAEVVYEIKETGDETSLVLLELYRYQGWWKLRAIGRGFNGGLQPLAEAHGVSVADEENEAEDAAPSPTDNFTAASSNSATVTPASSGQASVPISAAAAPISAPADAPADGAKSVSFFAAKAATKSVFSFQSRSSSIFALQPAATFVFPSGMLSKKTKLFWLPT